VTVRVIAACRERERERLWQPVEREREREVIAAYPNPATISSLAIWYATYIKVGFLADI
jgi:hypothetical protein